MMTNHGKATGLTTDPTDPRLTRGVDDKRVDQAEVYIVLSEGERAKGFVRPLRTKYTHNECDTETRMTEDIAATYAREPKFYGATYCVACRKHRPVAEFKWKDGTKVGS